MQAINLWLERLTTYSNAKDAARKRLIEVIDSNPSHPDLLRAVQEFKADLAAAAIHDVLSVSDILKVRDMLKAFNLPPIPDKPQRSLETNDGHASDIT